MVVGVKTAHPPALPKLSPLTRLRVGLMTSVSVTAGGSWALMEPSFDAMCQVGDSDEPV